MMKKKKKKKPHLPCGIIAFSFVLAGCSISNAFGGLLLPNI
jgi:hypothetical protein